MSIYDRDYMKNPPPDYDPEEDDDSRPSATRSGRTDDKLNRRITNIFAVIVLGAIAITILALLLGR